MQVWQDPWLPRENDCYVQSPCVPRFEYMQFSDLMNEYRLSWNVDMMKGLLIEEEAELGLSIPPSVWHRQDRCIWAPSRTGKYSVKSAYYSQLEWRRPSVGSTTSLWKCVWKVNVPPKIKNFMWRLMRNILPVKERLH